MGGNSPVKCKFCYYTRGDYIPQLLYQLTQPPDHLLNPSYEPLLLLLWVGVIIAEVSDASMSLGITKVEVDGFGMTNV